MSRHFVVNDQGRILRRKPKPKPYTPAWQRARAERKARRAHRVSQQARNEEGFIVIDVNGHQRLVDPGPINRELYTNARDQGRKDSWEVPNA